MELSKADKFFRNNMYADFICDYEDKWMQYASAEEKMHAYFGTHENALKLYDEWMLGNDPFKIKRNLLWSLERRLN